MSPHKPGQGEQAFDVDRRLEMVRQRIEGLLDLPLEDETRRGARAQAGEEGVAEGVGGEQAVQVAARNAAVGGDRAVRPAAA